MQAAEESGGALSGDESSQGDGWNEEEGFQDVSSPQRLRPEIVETFSSEDGSATFPFSDFFTLTEGLNKWPWVVYPVHLAACLEATRQIVGNRSNKVEHELKMAMRRLMREVTPDAFQKCFQDKAVKNWADDIQANIFDCSLRLGELVAEVLSWGMVEDKDFEEESLSLLRTLSLCFDKTCVFHVKHRDSLLADSTRHLENSFAAPLSIDATEAIPRKQPKLALHGKAKMQDGVAFHWLAYFINSFGAAGGFNELRDALMSTRSIVVAEACLRPIATVVEFLNDQTINCMLEACKRVSSWIDGIVRDNLMEKLADPRDGSYGALSEVIQHISCVLAYSTHAEAATAHLFRTTQKRVVEAMLDVQPSFSKQLTAVREINKLFEASRGESKGLEMSASELVSWIEGKKIMQKVLRSNLHHRQYVDQVERILLSLLQKSALAESYIDIMWGAVEAPDQHEAVKNNVLNLLAALAFSFPSNRVRTLFERFKQCQGKPIDDVLKVLELVKKLACNDRKASMADCVIDMLWSFLIAASTCEIRDMCVNGLTTVLEFYDAMVAEEGAKRKPHFLLRCLKLVEDSNLHVRKSGLRLFRAIVEQYLPASSESQGCRSEILKGLEQQHSLVPLLVRNVLDIVERTESHAGYIDESLSLLLFVLQESDSSIFMAYDDARCLWQALRQKPEYHDMAYTWFGGAVQCPVLSNEAQHRLLTDHLCMIPMEELSERGFSCFLSYFVWVNLRAKNLEVAEPDEADPQDAAKKLLSSVVNLPYLESLCIRGCLEGLEYVWTVVEACPLEPNAEVCMRILWHCHTCMCPKFEESNPGRLRSLIQRLRTTLGDACRLLRDHTPEKPAIMQTLRCLQCLRLCIEMSTNRPSTETIAPHVTTFRGYPLDIEVQAAIKPPNRFRLSLHSNCSIAELRALIRDHIKAEGRVRIVNAGKEIVNDSHTLEQAGVQHGFVLSATVTPPLPGEVPDQQAHEAPASILSQDDTTYDMLFSLLNSSSAEVKLESYLILELLPTDHRIVDRFNHSGSDEGSRKLKAYLGEVVSRPDVLYAVQIADSLLTPLDGVAPMSNEKHARSMQILQSFCGCGGVGMLLSVCNACIEGDAPLEGKSVRMFFSSGLRVLAFVLKSLPLDSECFQQKTVFQDIVRALSGLSHYVALGKLHESCAGLDGLMSEDVYLHQLSSALLADLLILNPDTLESFISPLGMDSPIIQSLLHSPERLIRQRSCDNILRLCSTLEVSYANKLKNALLTLFYEQQKAKGPLPGTCYEYFQLMSKVLSHTTAGGAPQDIGMAKELLEAEIGWLYKFLPKDESAASLVCGHLHLIRSLVQSLLMVEVVEERTLRIIANAIVYRFLFPEGTFLWRKSEWLTVDKAMSYDRVGSLCSSSSSRKAAMDLLMILCQGSITVMEVVTNSFVEAAFKTFETTCWEYSPSSTPKPADGYVGLANAGATCYMNAVFQQFFMQPLLRRKLLEAAEVCCTERPHSVLYQVQAIMGSLLGSSIDHHTPIGFWNAFKDCDGLPVNLREHQDAAEFFERLADQCDEAMKQQREEAAIQSVFGGVFAQQIICKDCPHRSSRDQEFMFLSVDVRNKRNLQESLEAFVKGELLEADNAYFCEQCSKKVDAFKRVAVRTLPTSLCIHLKRFDFDYETMQRLKVKDRFEFPMQLNLEPFTVEGLEAKEGCGANARAKEDYDYELVGVIVHSGSAFAGHYYSYIKERGSKACNIGGGEPLSQPQWFLFDDNRVEPYNIQYLEADCFGGKYSVDVFDNQLKESTNQVYERHYSAYMLLYEKCNPSVERDGTSSTRAGPGGDETVLLDLNSTEDCILATLKSLVVSLPKAVEASMPLSVLQSVVEGNLKFGHESKLLSPEIDDFLLSMLVSCTSKWCNPVSGRAGPQSVGAVAEKVGGGGSSDTNQAEASHSAPATQGESWRECAVCAVRLASQYFFRVYFRVHSSLRTRLEDWKDFMVSLMSSSDHACDFFLRCALTECRDERQPCSPFEMIGKCPDEEVRRTIVYFMGVAINHLCMKFLRTGNYDDLHSTTMIVEMFRDMLGQVSGKVNLYINEVILLLSTIAHHGYTARLLLLDQHILQCLCEIACRIALASEAVRSEEANNVHLLIFQLVRGSLLCTTAPQSADPDGERIASEARRLASNPYADGDKLVPLEHGICAKLGIAILPSYEAHTSPALQGPLLDYLGAVIDYYSANTSATDTLLCCCWENALLSQWVVEELLASILSSQLNDVPVLLTLLRKLALLNDSIQADRFGFLLVGGNSLREGPVTSNVTMHQWHAVSAYILNEDGNHSPKKRYLLLKWLVLVCDESEIAHSIVAALGDKPMWHQALQGLQDECAVSVGCATSSRRSSEALEELDHPGEAERIFGRAAQVLETKEGAAGS